jgi:hypothetical protein
MCDCAGRNRSSSARRNQAGHGKTMSGFQPPVLPSNGSYGRLCFLYGIEVPLGHSKVLECALDKRPKGGYQAQEVRSSLRATARSNYCRGEVGRMRVQANEDALRYRVGAVADRTRQHVQIGRREQVEHAFRHCPLVYEIADKRPNNKEFTACKDWQLRSQS